MKTWKVEWRLEWQSPFNWPYGGAYVPGDTWQDACENARAHFKLDSSYYLKAFEVLYETGE